MEKDDGKKDNDDHCRIGSLEINSTFTDFQAIDHCRIGSLEKTKGLPEAYEIDHCRIGSLERT